MVILLDPVKLLLHCPECGRVPLQLLIARTSLRHALGFRFEAP